ncbi:MULTISPECIES: hypothetical protein [Eubacteriales]|uniref:Uncharacterized protein n=1 Tax=Bittarella massiliensis (ex Durand et al. 2017) TaxID=1720313 RepID=A0ABW9WTB8_9FIRM|nr:MULTISPECIES: hypothetical protein [Eubacteriales]MZL69049.1 hypothetical protein [Bittarella massiliensis (ex Durand et al. 2017)]MZL79931.1 hypothetical protein [Bittarella massiliensis (ex Durand et al. 2017)]
MACDRRGCRENGRSIFSYVNTGEGLDRGWPVFDWPANAAVVRAIHISAVKRRLLEAIG